MVKNIKRAVSSSGIIENNRISIESKFWLEICKEFFSKWLERDDF